MAGEIDNLEIKISAEANQAAQSINELAGSFETLSNKSDGIRNKLNLAAEGIASVTDSLDGIGKITSSIEKIQESFTALSNLKAPKGLQEISESLKPLQEMSKSINTFSTTADVGSASKQLETLANSLDTIGKVKIGDAKQLKSFAKHINKIKFDPDNVKALASVGDAIDKISNAQINDDTAASLQKIIATVKTLSSKDVKRLNALSQATSNASSARSLNSGDASISIEETGNSSEKSSSKLAKFQSGLVELNEILTKVAKGAGKGLSGMFKTLTAPLSAIGKGFSKAAKKGAELLSSLKRIAMYRAIRTALKAISEGFEEGRKNLYYYSQATGTDFAKSMDKAATAALYLKNSIGAATAPLTNYLVPMIDRAVDHIVDLINQFNELTAVLTGASSWTKAVKYPTQWQESLEDADSKAKKLKSTMLGFDELNVIEPDSSGSKASGFTADDYSKMFEEVRTDMTLNNKIPDLIVPVKMAWDEEGDNTLQAIKDTWTDINGLILSVADSFASVWENGTGQQTLELILQIVQDIVGTFGALARGIKKAWNEGGRGTRIIQNVWNVANNVLSVFNDIWQSIKEWAEDLDWTPLFNSLDSLTEALDELTNPQSGAMQILKGLWKDVLLPFGKWAVESAAPISISALTAVIRTLKKTFDDLVKLYNENDIFRKIVDGLKEIAELTFTNITGLVASIETLMSLVNGSEVSDDSAKGLEDSNKKLKKVLGSGDEDNPNLYDKINKFMQGTGEQLFESWNKDFLSDDGFTFSSDPSQDTRTFSQKIGDSAWNNLKGTRTDSADGGLTFADTGFKGFNSEAERLLFKSENTDDIEEAHFFKDFVENIKTGFKEIEDAVSNSTVVQFVKDLLASWQDVGEWIYDFTHETWPQFWEGIGDSIYTFIHETWPQFWEGIGEKFADWIEGIKESWRTGWESIKQTASDIWKKIKKTLSDGWEGLKEKVSGFVTAWSDGFTKIKDWASDAWSHVTDKAEEMKTNLLGKVDNVKLSIKNKFDEIKSDITGAFGNAWIEVQKSISTFIGTATKMFGNLWDNGEGGGIAGKVSSLGQNIFDKFGEIKDDVVGLFTGIGDEIGKKLEPIKQTIGGLFNGVADKMRTPVNDTITAIEKAVNGIFDAISAITEWAGSKFTNSKMLNFVAEHLHIDLTNLNWASIPHLQLDRFANGGTPETGQLFIANEAGPELVGRFGNQTAVMNNEQIVAAVSEGVYRAVSQAMAQQNNSERPIQNHIYLDRKELTSQINQQNQANGVSIMSELIYT